MIIANLYNRETDIPVLSVAFRSKRELLVYTKFIKPATAELARQKTSINWHEAELLDYCYSHLYRVVPVKLAKHAAFKLTYPLKPLKTYQPRVI